MSIYIAHRRKKTSNALSLSSALKLPRLAQSRSWWIVLSTYPGRHSPSGLLVPTASRNGWGSYFICHRCWRNINFERPMSPGDWQMSHRTPYSSRHLIGQTACSIDLHCHEIRAHHHRTFLFCISFRFSNLRKYNNILSLFFLRWMYCDVHCVQRQHERRRSMKFWEVCSAFTPGRRVEDNMKWWYFREWALYGVTFMSEVKSEYRNLWYL